MSKEVNENGILKLLNEDGDIISSYLVSKVETEEKIVDEKEIYNASTLSKIKKISFMFEAHLLEFIFMLLPW